jgi:hypothetical protein
MVLGMQFIHYKDFPPINLQKVGTIGKENQQVSKEASIYSISFYEFERRLGYWMFQSEEERDQVFEQIKSQYSKEVAPKTTAAPSKPAFMKG